MKSVPALIEKKRDGLVLEDDEIRFLLESYVIGDTPDYQMAALAMAICIRGMNADETTALTMGMLQSGSVLTHSSHRGGRVVDKHSTGGIGDKTSLILAPLLASAGLRVPMISGRSLGITGGTLDKLESIPGFRTDLSLAEIEQQLETVGCVITGQTPEICPADRKLYALRDVTGTVPSRPLIVSSIMSKKLAESLDALVLDVKYGSGALMKSLADAQILAQEMTIVGAKMGVEVSTLLTPMNEPLGSAVGNALEVAEAVQALEGGGPDDLRRLVLDLADCVSSHERTAMEDFLNNGTALKKWREMVAAQGGDADADPVQVHPAKFHCDLKAPNTGTVTAVDAGIVGQVVLDLGAGRSKADDTIDFSVGLSNVVKVGTQVSHGQSLLIIHAASAEAASRASAELLDRAIVITPD
ncbi:MAG: thymidine phosphorylase [Verrucomicrobia bacterium]|nr:thymidine phosphorylase [Verrucomicrobiota bacterium]